MAKTHADSVVVNVTRLAEITGMSRWWARAKLEEWLGEQERGGPVRVFVSGKRKLLFTTLAIVQREFVGGTRDPVMMKKFQEQDRELDKLARRIDALTSEVIALRRLLGLRAS